MIRYLQLPYHFDHSRMQQEVTAITQSWMLHFNTAHYQGDWSGIPLRSPGGNADNLLPQTLQQNTNFEDTELLEQCPYISEVLDAFQCKKTTARLLKLSKGAVVKEHRDLDLAYEEGEVRLHIPVITHPLVEFYLDDHRLEMKEGDCWYINANLPHRLSNPSPVDRVHLVVDCIVNDWLRKEFSREDVPVKSIKNTADINIQQQQRVIVELRLSNDPVRMALADELEKQLLQ